MKTKLSFNKLTAWLLMLTMLLFLVPGTVASVFAQTDALTDEVTGVTLYDADSDDYYEISKADELVAFANLVNDGNYTINIELVKDIDMTGIEWSTIVYGGAFDGAGHIISNLTMPLTEAEGDNVAGFMYTNEATVKNIYFKNCSVDIPAETSVYNIYAAIIAPVSILSTFENCSLINCTVEQSGKASNFAYSAGIVGIAAYGLEMDYCSVQGGSITDDSASFSYVGGLIGNIWDDEYCGDTSVTNSFCTADVSANGSGSWIAAGGLAGGILDDSQSMKTTFENCYISGDVTSVKQVGGLIGDTVASSVTVKNCAVLSKNVTGTYGDPFSYGEWAKKGTHTNSIDVSYTATYSNLYISGTTSFTLNAADSKNIFDKDYLSDLCTKTEENAYTWDSAVTTLDADAVSSYEISYFPSNLYGKLADGRGNVTITLSQDNVVKYTAVTDSDGEYNFGKQVLAGDYTLDIAKIGKYEAYTQTVTVGYASNQELNITRTVGEIPEITLTSAKVTVSKLSESAVLIVASYAGDELVDAKQFSVTQDCEKTISETTLSTNGADTVRAFLWDSMTDIIPLCESKPVTIQQ